MKTSSNLMSLKSQKMMSPRSFKVNLMLEGRDEILYEDRVASCDDNVIRID